jgi:hypothetical protein
MASPSLGDCEFSTRTGLGSLLHVSFNVELFMAFRSEAGEVGVS